MSAKITDLEAKLEIVKDSVPADKIRIYENEIEDLRLRIRALEETEIEEASALEKEKDKMQVEINRLKEELLQRQKAYEENLDVLDKRLKEVRGLCCPLYISYIIMCHAVKRGQSWFAISHEHHNLE